MAYELRVDGQAGDCFDTSDEAEARARAMIRENADRIIEIIDLTTGRPYAPAASADERDALARKIGF